jgi:hypothetical protein
MNETTLQVSRVESAPALVAEFRADYVDAFQIEPVPGATARAWMEASLHGSDAHGGLFRSVVWHGLLRFDLAGPDRDGTAFGWQVSADRHDLVVLDVDGPLAAGRMVFAVADETTWTTMLRFHRRRTAHVLWAAIGPGHRAVVPSCLDRAARHLRGTTLVTDG